MNIVLIEKLYTLKDILNNHPKVLFLKASEKLLEESFEVQALSELVKEKEKQYNDLVEIYDKNHNEVKEAQKNLFEAKLKLDQNPLVENYLKAFQAVRSLYELINEVLFNPFLKESCATSC